MKESQHPASSFSLSDESSEGEDCDFFISGLAFDFRHWHERQKDFAARVSGDGVGDGRRTADDGAGRLVVVGTASQRKEQCGP